jgi:hypothetical protein
MKIVPMGVWAEDPVAYEPDAQRYEDYPEE